MIDYGNILSIYYKDKKWFISDSYDYDTLDWLDESNKPSKSLLDSKDIEAKLYIKKNNCKIQAKKLIAEYDWINDDTTTPVLLNKNDFYAYRSALRELILNPVENPVWPEIPQEEWA